MSAILHRLATRAIGSPTEVRPRLPGRFEPADRAAVGADLPLATPPARIAGPALAEPAPPAPVPRTKSDAIANAAAPAPSPEEPPDAGSRAEPSADRDEAAGPATRPADAGSGPSKWSARRAPLKVFTPLRPPDDVTPNAGFAPTSLLPPQPAGPRATPRATAEPPSAAPDIHISIGRIDVRAPPPPASPPRRADPGERLMSLDTYLAGGTR